MLTHAFEQWGCQRVCFRATWFNHPSQRAIERLGAVFEGRIRNDRILRTGEVTHTAQYSVACRSMPLVGRRAANAASRTPPFSTKSSRCSESAMRQQAFEGAQGHQLLNVSAGLSGEPADGDARVARRCAVLRARGHSSTSSAD